MIMHIKGLKPHTHKTVRATKATTRATAARQHPRALRFVQLFCLLHPFSERERERVVALFTYYETAADCGNPFARRVFVCLP